MIIRWYSGWGMSEKRDPYAYNPCLLYNCYLFASGTETSEVLHIVLSLTFGLFSLSSILYIQSHRTQRRRNASSWTYVRYYRGIPRRLSTNYSIRQSTSGKGVLCQTWVR